MKNSNEFNTFDEYWATYLREHTTTACRALHYTGLVAGLATATVLVLCGLFFFLPVAVVVASVFASLGHRFEAGKRGARRSAAEPVWAAAADVKMLGMAASGRLSRELDALSSPRTSLA